MMYSRNAIHYVAVARTSRESSGMAGDSANKTFIKKIRH